MIRTTPCTWASRTPKSSPDDRVTTFVCTDKEHRQLVKDLRTHLRDDLRKKPYRGNPNPWPATATWPSEAIFHTLGGKSAGWTPQTIQHEGVPLSTPPPTNPSKHPDLKEY